MKILVSGLTGFVGHHLGQRLINEGYNVHAIVRHPAPKLKKLGIKTHIFNGQTESLMKLTKRERFDGVIHLASLFLAKHTPEDIKGLIDSNLLFGAQLLEAAAQNNVSWFINTGTFWQHYQNQPYSPVNLYAATKQAFEDIARYYTETTPMTIVTLKLSDTFGPNDTRPKIFTLWLRIGTSKEGLNMSPGEQLLDISFIDNVVDGYLRLITLLSKESGKTLRGQDFALKARQPLSLKKLAQVFEQVTGTTLHINWGKLPYRPREVMVPWNRGKTVPGYKPKVSLEEGIKKTFDANQS
jgi:CDP-paratose synthetase